MLAVPFCVFAQGSGEPQPPPVNIEISMRTISKVGGTVELKIKVTPEEDMHADISCLLPEGIKPVREKGVIVRPCMEREGLDLQQQTRYMEAIELWVGPLEAGATKEFSFQVLIPDKEKYEFIARVEALAKWGVKERVFAVQLM